MAIPNEINRFIHCGQCLSEKPGWVAPREWTKLEVGFTADGHVQVWCRRHEKNVVQIICIGEVRLRTDADAPTQH